MELFIRVDVITIGARVLTLFSVGVSRACDTPPRLLIRQVYPARLHQ